MTQFKPRYTPEQKQAVIQLVQAGHTYRQAVQAAAEGINGIDPFHMPESSARDVMRTHRQRQRKARLEADPQATIGEIAWRIIRHAQRLLDKYDDTGKPDMRALKELGDVLVVVRKLAIEPRSPNAPDPPASALTQQLLAAANSDNGGVRSDARAAISSDVAQDGPEEDPGSTRAERVRGAPWAVH